MPTNTTTTVFADPETVSDEIATLIAATPAATWAATDIIATLDHHTVLDILMCLARLTRNGQIERTAPGRYRHPRRPADALAAQLRRRTFDDK